VTTMGEPDPIPIHFLGVQPNCTFCIGTSGVGVSGHHIEHCPNLTFYRVGEFRKKPVASWHVQSQLCRLEKPLSACWRKTQL